MRKEEKNSPDYTWSDGCDCARAVEITVAAEKSDFVHQKSIRAHVNIQYFTLSSDLTFETASRFSH